MEPEPDALPLVILTEDRSLRFEAKKFALETLIRIYLEQSSGARALVVSHTRVMLTLSLAAMAGFVTVFAAMLRTGPVDGIGWTQPLSAGLALSGLGLLVASALWAAKALSLAAKVATDSLRNPFPTARKELEDLFNGGNEDLVLDKLLVTVQLYIADTAPSNNLTGYATISLVGGIILAASSLVLPLLIGGR